MKKIFIIGACCLAQLAAMAQPKQDVRAAHTKIADLLAQQPAKDAKALNANMAALSDMGEEGITGMAAMLTPAGKGDNAAIEYTLGGYAFYVTQPGREKERGVAVNAYSKAIKQVADVENKAFLITMLQHMGTNEAVSTLLPFLADARLCDPAARTLVKINTPAAQKALLEALPKATGRNQQILAEVVGDARIAGATAALLPLARSQDQMLVKTALYALAHIAEPEAAGTLKAAAVKAGYKYDESNATASYLLYAHQLA